MPLVAILAAPSVAHADERVDGTFESLERFAVHYLLVLKNKKKYVVTSKVYNRHLRIIKSLKKGAKVRFKVNGNRVTKFLTGSRTVARDVLREGIYSRYETSNRLLWFTNDTAVSVSKKLDKKSLKVLHFLRKGQRIRVMIRNDEVIEIRRSVGGRKENPKVTDVLRRSRIGDNPIKIKLKGDPRYKVFRLRYIGASQIRVSPQLPSGKYSGGQITLERHKIEDLSNPKADDPSRGKKNIKDGGPTSDEDPFDKEGVQVGDMIGIGFDKGQLIRLNDKTYELRLWENGRWGSDPQPLPRAKVKSVFFAKLSSRQSIPLAGGAGDLEVTVVRSRKGRRGGLGFDVVLNHNVKGVILVDLQARFHLSRQACMGPRDRANMIEPKAIELPMFTNMPQRIVHDVSNDELLDGRVEVVVFPRNVVRITNKGARTHLIRVLQATKKVEALRAIYVAAAENGDPSIANYLMTIAVNMKDKEHKHALEKGLAAHHYKALVPKLIIDVLGGLDRDLKVWAIREGALVRVPLPSNEKPGGWKRKLVRLLSDLPTGLSGKSGSDLFELYQTRYQTLGEAIEKAFKRRPAAAVQTLLGIAVRQTADAQAVERAERATLLLRKLGDAACPELFKELRKHGLDPSKLEKALSQRTIAPEEVVRRAIGTLVKLISDQIAKKLSDMVEKATEHHANKEMKEALEILRKVLAQKANHQEAKTLLPQVLIDLARQHQKAGNRGLAARCYEEALEKLKGGQKAKAALPLAELLVQSADEAVDEVIVRSLPHGGADKVRAAKHMEVFPGEESKARGWIKIQAKDQIGYIRKDVLKAQTGKQEGKWKVVKDVTPFGVIKEQLDAARALAPGVGKQADEVMGRLAAREGEMLYNAGDYKGAINFFNIAAEHAPTDPRLSLKWKCWLKANTTALGAVVALVLLAIGIASMNLFSRPKKVKFGGEYRHYGADRSARERDLDLGDEGGGGEG